MKAKILVAGGLVAGLIGGFAARADVDSGEFGYQGQLKFNGVPVSSTCDFEFSLWRDAESTSAGDQVGTTLTFDGNGNPGPIDVVNGLFSVVLDFGPTAFTEEARWLDTAVRCPAGAGDYSVLVPRERITGVPYAVRTRGIAVDSNGGVGIGTETPQTLLHVRGLGRFRGNHIAYFESTGTRDADGIAIQLSNENTNRDNNFITFYNRQEIVTGRIEGFDLENGDWIAPPPLPDVSLSIDPNITYNPDWFNPGSLPTATFNPGSLPTANFNPGQLPTVNFNPGQLPSLTFSGGSLPSANLNRGSFPTLTFDDGSLPSFSANFCNVVGVQVLCGFNWSAGSTPSADLEGGSLPSLTFNPGTLPTATFNRGTLPSLTFSGGSLPNLTFSGGTFPSLVFSGGALPSIEEPPFTIGEPSLLLDLPTAEELEALFCWASENGVSDFLTMDPISLAVSKLKEQVAMICKDEGVTYGSKGADYAEWLPKLDPGDRFQFGQIVGVHGGKVSLKTEGAEQIMAVSRAPVVVGNVPLEDDKDKYVTVGFMGQLPVVVRGKVRAGDYVIPSGLEDGTATAVAPEDLEFEHLGRTLGRAWADSDNDVYSLINVVIGLNTNEAKIILRKQRDQIEAQKRMSESLALDNARLQSQLTAMNDQLASLIESVQTLEDRAAPQVDCARVAAAGLDH